jgi:hypothetical protein
VTRPTQTIGQASAHALDAAYRRGYHDGYLRGCTMTTRDTLEAIIMLAEHHGCDPDFLVALRDAHARYTEHARP